MPNCPKCGAYLTDGQWQLHLRGVEPYYRNEGERCNECGVLKTNAPTASQLERGVRVDPWGHIVGFDGQSIRLKRDSIERHKRNITSCAVTIAYHQTNADAARSIMRSQKFRAGTQGCVGAGMYFARSPEETYPKTTSRGVILAADVRLGNKFNVSLQDSKNGTWNRHQKCEDSLAMITEHGCR